jgi:hypothetical protein
MPKVQGSMANQTQTATHAFHGASIHNATPKKLTKYIKLSVEQKEAGFEVAIKNETTHTLFPQPLRLNQLKVRIEREGKTIALKTESFAKIIGTNGKPAMPWLADAVISDTSIKAHETRKVPYDTPLQKGDAVIIEFGYYMVNPKAAKALEITDKSVTEFIILTKERVEI